jgi:hypothetical protein
MRQFASSRKKIQRAAKHISDLNAWLGAIITDDFYRINVEQDAKHMGWLSLDFDPLAFPTEDAAVLMGDALHNLRSALDILWHDVITECGGTTSKFTRFLIRDTRDELVAPLKNALKEQQIIPEVHDFLLDTE